MSKGGFLRRLRQALVGNVPPGAIEGNTKYYDNYTSGEVRRGQPGEEVIAAIGDPWLIAKTIEGTMEDVGEGGYTDADDRSGYGSYERDPYKRNTYEWNSYGTNRSFHMVDLNK